jgi:LysM repeat protein
MDGPKDPIARVLAVLALATSLVVLIAVIAGSVGDEGGDTKRRGERVAKQATQRPPKPKAAVKDTYIVRSGDSLSTIADEAGIRLDELTLLNPELDPQALIAGQCVRLRRSGKCG